MRNMPFIDIPLITREHLPEFRWQCLVRHRRECSSFCACRVASRAQISVPDSCVSKERFYSVRIPSSCVSKKGLFRDTSAFRPTVPVYSVDNCTPAYTVDRYPCIISFDSSTSARHVLICLMCCHYLSHVLVPPFRVSFIGSVARCLCHGRLPNFDQYWSFTRILSCSRAF